MFCQSHNKFFHWAVALEGQQGFFEKAGMGVGAGFRCTLSSCERAHALAKVVFKKLSVVFVALTAEFTGFRH